MEIEERIEVICDWIVDLAEARFEQAHADMEDGDSRCCLGVAREHVGGADMVGVLSFDADATVREAHQAYLAPHEVRALGLHAATGRLKVAFRSPQGRAIDSLSYMNDYGFTHPQIAEYIISNPENVFNDPRIAEGVKEFFWMEAK